MSPTVSATPSPRLFYLHKGFTDRETTVHLNLPVVWIIQVGIARPILVVVVRGYGTSTNDQKQTIKLAWQS
jgi:hypothetical protein